MSQHLVLSVRLHDHRYHGVTEWPPSPARVFQALIAGVARGLALPQTAMRAFEWLECLAPPIIAAPSMHLGSAVDIFVPNNDADAVGGDPGRIGEIRTKKRLEPRLLEDDAPLIYAWQLNEATEHAMAMIDAAHDLYQLGRGVDMAWAVGELASNDDLVGRLAAHSGTIYHPTTHEGEPLACPAPGSLASLIQRHRAGITKLRLEGTGRTAKMLFAQPPKPRFAPVSYRSAGRWVVYELRDRADDRKLWPWPLSRVAALVEQVRNSARARLLEAFPDRRDTIERVLIGCGPEVPELAPVARRVRIVPLPSIGHDHADRAVRRIAILAADDALLDPRDVHWAFSGLEVGPFVAVPTIERDMLDHFHAGQAARRWRSITPLVLPTDARRRRIEPSRRVHEAKGASERNAEEQRACDAVRTALRHAGMRAASIVVSVQREPFESRGARAEHFAEGTRFEKERVWHVEIESRDPLEGPLVLGDGRYLGLGLFAAVPGEHGIFAFAVTGDVDFGRADALVRAMRRAIMSRVQLAIGDRALGRFFSGHEVGGEPARTELSNHIAIQWDPHRRCLLVIAPHILDRRPATWQERRDLALFDLAIEGFSELRAGHAGRCHVSRCISSVIDAYSGTAKSWVSIRPYLVTRHRKRESASDAIVEDVIVECRRAGLPKPGRVTVLRARGVPDRGLEGVLRLDFVVPVAGPVVLGRSRYRGGGLFAPASEPDAVG